MYTTRPSGETGKNDFYLKKTKQNYSTEQKNKKN